MPKTPSSLYAAKVRAGDLDADPGQKQVLAELDELAGQLDGYALPSGGSGGLAWLFKRKQKAHARSRFTCGVMWGAARP
jgi:predicted ATPase